MCTPLFDANVQRHLENFELFEICSTGKKSYVRLFEIVERLFCKYFYLNAYREVFVLTCGAHGQTVLLGLRNEKQYVVKICRKREPLIIPLLLDKIIEEKRFN